MFDTSKHKTVADLLKVLDLNHIQDHDRAVSIALRELLYRRDVFEPGASIAFVTWATEDQDAVEAAEPKPHI